MALSQQPAFHSFLLHHHPSLFSKDSGSFSWGLRRIGKVKEARWHPWGHLAWQVRKAAPSQRPRWNEAWPSPQSLGAMTKKQSVATPPQVALKTNIPHSPEPPLVLQQVCGRQFHPLLSLKKGTVEEVWVWGFRRRGWVAWVKLPNLSLHPWQMEIRSPSYCST